MSQNRAKFGYLAYNDMLQKITDGVLDQHDVVFTKDTKETFIIDPDGNPIALRSKVYVYDSMTEAIRELNRNTDTYVGQVVSILEGETYRGYIVNQNTKQKTTYYTVSPLTDTSSIDYNTLGNKPIINLVGTLDEPIILSNLDNGTYSILGQYMVYPKDITTFLNASPIIVLIEIQDSKKYIKKISSTEIIDYEINEDSISCKKYLTDLFLKENGYATISYVDNKIATLDFITKNEITEYVDNLVNEKLENILDSKIDAKIDEKIQPVEEDVVVSLFSL